ncbi:restriction endonuclease subunit S [Rothia sp. L_38]|uniref:restriction endonuclease subunit S n=1 Tax=Rothia sp. L_38 TaxID=3422315 RepID=UPI003D6A477A
MSNKVPFKVRWLSGGVPNHWKIVEPRRIFKLVKEPERPGDIHLTPSQRYGVLPQEEYMKITGARVVQNLSGTQMQHVEPGDFISHLRTFQGGLELATMPGKVSPAYTVLRPSEAVYPGFFKHVLKSPSYISQIASVTDQLRDGQTMRFNEFNLTWLPLPPLEEQKKIADKLDRELAEIDEFIADQQRLLELATEKFNAELRQLTFPTNAPTVPLKRFAQITLGKMITPSNKGGMELAPYIRAANIQPGGVFTYQSDYKKMWFSSDELAHLDLKKGDVLVVEGGAGFGRSAVLTEDLPGWGFQNSINRVRVKPGLADPHFIDFCIRAKLLSGELENLTSQSTIPHLTAEKLAQAKIPDFSHQNQIATSQTLINKLGEIIETKQQIQTSIDLLVELKKAKINKEW